MTDIQVGTKKTANKENKKNTIDRPAGIKSNERTHKRYVNYQGKPSE